MHENGRGERPGPIRHMQIEQKRMATGPSIFDALLIGRCHGQAGGAHEGDNDGFHEADCIRFGPDSGPGTRD